MSCWHFFVLANISDDAQSGIKQFVPATTVTSKKRLRVKFATYVRDNINKIRSRSSLKQIIFILSSYKNAHHSRHVASAGNCFLQRCVFLVISIHRRRIFTASQNKPQRESVKFFLHTSLHLHEHDKWTHLWAKFGASYSIHRLAISASVHWKAQLLS